MMTRGTIRTRPAGEPFGRPERRFTPWTQPLAGHDGHTTRDVSSSTTTASTAAVDGHVGASHRNGKPQR
jgi:hypothetical protein